MSTAIHVIPEPLPTTSETRFAAYLRTFAGWRYANRSSANIVPPGSSNSSSTYGPSLRDVSVTASSACITVFTAHLRRFGLVCRYFAAARLADP